MYELLCKEGEHVNAGQDIIELESMKMHFPHTAPVAGVVHYKVQPGNFVDEGALLAEIE